eukprot:1143210-Pelagomonas_calceolata.AAC.3
MTNIGATEPKSEPPSKRTCSRHRASTASPTHSIHTLTQTNVLSSTQNVSPLTCPAYEKRTKKTGLPASVHALQRSKNLGMRCSNVARTPQDPVSINITLYQRRFKSALRRRKFEQQDLQSPTASPPRKQKHSSPTHCPPPRESPDVNPQPRNAFNIPLGDAPNIRANPPGLQTELP